MARKTKPSKTAPMPTRPTKQAVEAAYAVAVAEMAYAVLDLAREFSEDAYAEDGPMDAQTLLMLVCGVDANDREREPEDLDRVERGAYETVCAHLGLKPAKSYR